MKSRALLLVSASLAALLIGCGGGGGGGNSNPNPTTGSTGAIGATQPGDSQAMVNLPKTVKPSGRINIAYLPLQGRAIENFVAVIPNTELGFGSDLFLEPLSSDIQFIMNGNAVQERSSTVPVTDGISRPFNTFYLNIDTLIDDTAPGTSGGKTSFGTPDEPFVAEMPFSANLRVFPGRETTVPLFLNDSMLTFTTDPVTGGVSISFNPDEFRSRNGSPIQGFISDFVAFDISGMGGNRPVMSNGHVANKAYFSGDDFAFSDAGPSGYFEMLTQNLTQPDHGEFTDPITTSTSNSPGVYRTLVPDPTDPLGQNQITELYGIFHNFVDPNSDTKSIVINTGNFEVLLMPKTADDEDQQILLVAKNGSVVTNMYWGDAHLASGSFVAYPLANIYNGSTAGAIQGTLNGYLDVIGNPLNVSTSTNARLVHYGRYQITSVLPAGFSQSGRFVVFRK